MSEEAAGLKDAASSETRILELVLQIQVLRRQVEDLEAAQAEGQRAAETLRRGSADLERLFLLSLDMLCIAGVDGYFNRVNPAFERILGYSCDELLARPFLEFVHPEDRDKTLAELQSLSEGVPTVRFVNRYRTKEGAYRSLQWMAMPREQEGLIYASAHDITEQQRSEEWMRAILELAPTRWS